MDLDFNSQYGVFAVGGAGVGQRQISFRTSTWTDIEIEVLKKNYPKYSVILKLLPHRTRSACGSMCYRLALVQRKPRWEPNEIALLRKTYPKFPNCKLLQLFPNRTRNAIYGMAKSQCIRKLKQPPKLSGRDIIDAILRRAFDLSYSMKDLSEELQSRYFSQISDKGDYLDMVMVEAALNLLEGKLIIRWK